MDLVIYTVLLLFAISLSAQTHEFGHYIVARIFNVHTTKYEIGAGPCVFKWIDKKGAEIRFCAIPIGGFTELWRLPWAKPDLSKVAAGSTAWQTLAPHTKFIVAIAGPVANFALAGILIFFVQLTNPKHVDTMVDVPNQDSLAHTVGLRSGDRITSIDNQAIDSWQDIGLTLLAWTGETGTFPLEVDRDGEALTFEVQVVNWLADKFRSRAIEDFGIRRGQAPVVGESEFEPLLQPGDRINSVDAVPVKTWNQFARAVSNTNEESASIEITRNGEPQSISVSLSNLIVSASQNEHGVAISNGEMGLEDMRLSLIAAPSTVVANDQGIFSRMWDAVVDFFTFIFSTIDQFFKMIFGNYSFANLLGVMQMTQLGTPAAEMNWQIALMFLAIMSIACGILNLLPGPIVDGYELIEAVVEMVRKKPVTGALYYTLFSIGTFIAYSPLVIVITFDLIRYFG